MNFIENTNEFLKKLSEVNSLIIEGNTLPNQVFQQKFTKFLIIEFNEIFKKIFFQQINSFVKKINDSRWNFAVLEPKPKNFFKYFKKYPFFEIDYSDSYEDYFLLTRNEPEPSSDEAIIYNMEVAVLYSTSLSWSIYADRDFELAIIAFQDNETVKSFISECREIRIFTITEAIPELLKVIYVNNIVPEDTRIQLLENYEREIIYNLDL